MPRSSVESIQIRRSVRPVVGEPARRKSQLAFQYMLTTSELAPVISAGIRLTIEAVFYCLLMVEFVLVIMIVMLRRRISVIILPIIVIIMPSKDEAA